MDIQSISIQFRNNFMRDQVASLLDDFFEDTPLIDWDDEIPAITFWVIFDQVNIILNEEGIVLSRQSKDHTLKTFKLLFKDYVKTVVLRG